MFGLGSARGGGLRPRQEDMSMFCPKRAMCALFSWELNGDKLALLFAANLPNHEIGKFQAHAVIAHVLFPVHCSQIQTFCIIRINVFAANRNHETGKGVIAVTRSVFPLFSDFVKKIFGVLFQIAGFQLKGIVFQFFVSGAARLRNRFAKSMTLRSVEVIAKNLLQETGNMGTGNFHACKLPQTDGLSIFISNKYK